MILIADSGSTKTDWCLVEPDEQSVRMFRTEGINPFFQSEEQIAVELSAALLPQLQGQVPESVYFYGAGCLPGSEKVSIMNRTIAAALNVECPIEINTDMLAAARALCGHEPGIACILGTGSNSCLYNGKQMVNHVSPLGFILGDEGSGAVLGKLLVGDLLKNQLPEGVKEQFLCQYNLTPSEIIDRVYRQPFPNRFLASLSPFLAQHMELPQVRALVLNSFRSFFERNVKQYHAPHLPVHFIGSIAYHYQKFLYQVACDLNIEIGTIAQSPMNGLIAFHQHIPNSQLPNH